MNLLIWVGLGVIINIVLLKDELLNSKDTLLAGVILVVLRAIFGGLLSDFIFTGGIGSMDLQTFTAVGIAPIIVLFIAKFMEMNEKNKYIIQNQNHLLFLKHTPKRLSLT